MQEQDILDFAKQYGVESNYLFKTTFDMYLSQLQIIETLKKEWQSSGVLVEKQYVKDAKNQYINPAIKEYNKAIAEANRTAKVLIQLIKDISRLNKSDDENNTAAIINSLNKYRGEAVAED